MKMTQKQLARIQFADWLAENHPDIYSQAISTMDQATAQLGQWNLFSDTQSTQTATPKVETKSGWETFADTVSKLGTAYLGYRQQKELIDINVERAKQGMPPIDAAQMAPVVRTQIGIDPETASRIASSAGEKMNVGLLAIGGIALLALMMMRKR